MIFDLIPRGSAVFSPCGNYRYLLERQVRPQGIRTMKRILCVGNNPSKATASNDDATSRKWCGFTMRNDGYIYIAVNAFAAVATNVRDLRDMEDPIGPDNDRYIQEGIGRCDEIWACWGNRLKLPKHLRPTLDALTVTLLRSMKPLKVFGLTRLGDPMHPLMLGYATPLIDWLPSTSEPCRASNSLL